MLRSGRWIQERTLGSSVIINDSIIRPSSEWKNVNKPCHVISRPHSSTQNIFFGNWARPIKARLDLGRMRCACLAPLLVVVPNELPWREGFNGGHLRGIWATSMRPVGQIKIEIE